MRPVTVPGPSISSHSGQKSGIALNQEWRIRNMCPALPHLPPHPYNRVLELFMELFPAELAVASGIFPTYSPQD